MSKMIVYDSDAKQKILKGVEKLEKAVSVTLGPCGKNVLIEEFGSVHSTKDGVTVAKVIQLEDKFENLGAAAVKEVAEKSADRVGDGTTTSTILAAQIFRNGLRHVSLGSNASRVKNGIKMAAAKAAELVKAASKPISSKADIRKVAVISANGDEKIGDVISEVMDRIGNDGTVKVENGNGVDTTYKVVEGMTVDKSYASPYMVTNPETMEAELDNPFVLVADKKISNFKELLPSLQAVSSTGRPLLLIAESYADEVLATLIMNKMRGGLNSVAVEAPSYGDNRKAILEDIAVLCGGRVVSDATGTRLENAVVQTGVLGQAQRVVVNKDGTMIMGGAGAGGEALASRVKGIRAQIENADEYDAQKLRERLAKLTSGIGVISVGATTDAERKELRDRVDDAFCAAKAAIKSGVVAGGGVALLNAKRGLEEWAAGQEFKADEGVGAQIFIDALDAPITKILSNAGVNAAEKVSRIDASRGEGYDVVAGEYANMVERGIIDPTDVVVNEIANAASIGGLLLTTEVLVADKPEKECGCQA